MSLFLPDFMFDKIWNIDIDFFKTHEIKCILLDVDNTLTTHGNSQINPLANEWLNKIKQTETDIVIISNNDKNRVEPFAENLNVKCVYDAGKPLKKGVKIVKEITGVSKENMLIIGDQIFTDVLFGKFSGVKTVLLTPILPENGKFFKFKRFLENIILRNKRR